MRGDVSNNDEDGHGRGDGIGDELRASWPRTLVFLIMGDILKIGLSGVVIWAPIGKQMRCGSGGWGLQSPRDRTIRMLKTSPD